MKIPRSNRKKALVLVDVQPGFLNERNGYIVQNIQKLIERVPYDLYAACIFHAEKGSLWDKQTGWSLPRDGNFRMNDALAQTLAGKECLLIEKETKSAFKGTVHLQEALRERGIEEIHIAGLDANDCVLATAYEAFDLGFFTYVIEECTDASDSAEMREAGFAVLRHVNLTNNSGIEKIDFAEI